MVKIQKFFLFSWLLCVACLLSFTSQANNLKRVLIIQSYGKNNPSSKPQEEGIREVLQRSGLNLQIKTFYMDTKKRYITPKAIAQRGKLARAKILKWRPDVVIVIDDNACKEVMLKMIDTPYKFVFSGMNMPPEVYNKEVRFMESRQHPGHNVTGVFEKLYITASVKIAQEILPHLKKAFLFVSTSPTGKALKQAALYELRNNPVPLEIKQVATLKEYAALLAQLNKTYSPQEAIIIPILDRLKAEKKVFNLLEVVDFTLSHNRLPEIGGSLSMVERGCLGTAALDLKKMGKQAGEKAVLVLKGTPPGNIPIEDARGYKIVLNLRRAKELGIKIPFTFLISADIILGGEELSK